jgi:hypothetical protein
MTIVRARVLHDHVVQFTLDNGMKIERDFSLIEGRAFDRTWRDPQKFNRVTVVDGRLTWPGKLEFSPEVVLRGGRSGRIPKRAFVGRGVLHSPGTVATAYHEAGHAAVGFQLGRRMPRRISILPQGSSLGRMQNRSFPRWFRPELRLPARTRQALETEAATILAGFEAEKLYTGKPNYLGAGPDFEGAKVYARLVASDDEGVTAYIGWCLYRARQAVMDNWPAIDRFARDLLEKGELFGRELQAKLKAACRLGKGRERPRG